MKTIIFSVKNSYFFSCLLENSVWSGNAKEYNFWIFTHFFFLWDFPSMFYVIETKQHKKKYLGIYSSTLVLSECMKILSQSVAAKHTPKGYPNSPHPCLCHLLCFIIYDSYPIPQQRKILSVTSFCEGNFKIEDDANSLV